MKKPGFTDAELDVLLKSAKQPVLPEGFAARLEAKLQTATKNNIIAFPTRQKPVQSASSNWLSAIPLAASLAVGIYLGAMAELPNVFSSFEDAVSAVSGDDELNVGIEDTESFLNSEPS
jgi:hypothetical protein